MPRATLARTTFVFAAATAATTGFYSTTALAGLVPIGAADVAPEGVPSDAPALAGEVLADKQTTFSIDDWVTGETMLAGTVDQRVIRETGTQSITFHYLITNTPGPEGSGELFRTSAFSFGEFVTTDVGYLVDDAAAGSPSGVGRTADSVDAAYAGGKGVLNDGDAVSFFVRTNATTFDETGLFALDALAAEPDPVAGSNVRTAVVQGMYRAVVQGPVAIPLPGAVYTGLIGLGTVAWAKRRKAVR